MRLQARDEVRQPVLVPFHGIVPDRRAAVLALLDHENAVAELPAEHARPAHLAGEAFTRARDVSPRVRIAETQDLVHRLPTPLLADVGERTPFAGMEESP